MADRAAILARLRAAYPYIFFDQRARRGPAILAKRPWLATGIVQGTADHPLAAWARFEQDGQSFEAASVHTANPFRPEEQAEDMDRLIAFVHSRAEPMILSGDFNLTPFSWKLTKLARLTGLKWARTFGASWPANKFIPVVLLDHILVSNPFGVAKAGSAERVGSDHLPVNAELGSRE